MNTDPCLNKHQGNAASNDAYAAGEQNHERDRDVIYKIYCERPVYGATSKEVAQLMGRPLNAISGRLTELCAMGLLRKTDDRREKATVLVAVKAQGRLI